MLSTMLYYAYLWFLKIGFLYLIVFWCCVEISCYLSGTGAGALIFPEDLLLLLSITWMFCWTWWKKYFLYDIGLRLLNAINSEYRIDILNSGDRDNLGFDWLLLYNSVWFHLLKFINIRMNQIKQCSVPSATSWSWLTGWSKRPNI